MIGVACLGLALTGLLCWPADPSRRAAVWLAGASPGRGRAAPSWLAGTLGVLGVIAAVALVAPRWLVWVVPGLAAVGAVSWLIGQSRAERARRDGAEEVVQACQAIAAQLRVGDIPARALATVAVESPLLRPVAATQAIGGDVPAALRAVAARPGCGGFFALARSWQLCQWTGAPIADAAVSVAEALRAEASAERLVGAELAAAKASGRMMAALPGLGVGMGFVGGGDPLEFLTGTLPGQICLAAAICLVSAGLVWTNLLGRGPAESAERQ